MRETMAKNSQRGTGPGSDPGARTTSPLDPLEVLVDVQEALEVPLSPALRSLYGSLTFPPRAGRPYVISNFVSTLDGVVSLGLPGVTDGDTLSGTNRHDSFVMALLRAVCDVVVVGANSLRKSSQHIWTPEHVYPELEHEFRMLRQQMRKEREPVSAFVTASGNIDPSLPVFQKPEIPSAIITTASGADRITKLSMPLHVEVLTASSTLTLTAKEIMDALIRAFPSAEIVMVEGGPHLIGYFFEEGLLDELYLTVAPQIAGRDGHLVRLGLVEGKIFSPDRPVWGTLTGLRKGGSHLFLRYRFA